MIKNLHYLNGLRSLFRFIKINTTVLNKQTKQSNSLFSLFILVIINFLIGAKLNAQTTVTYAQRTSNYSAGSFIDSGGFYDSGSYQLGMWAHGSGGKNIVKWRTLKTDGSNAGSPRPLKVGDEFRISVSANTVYGEMGFALLSSPSSRGSWADRLNNAAISINLTNYGNWYAKYSDGTTVNAGTSSSGIGGNTSYKQFVFTCLLTAPNRMNVTITDGSTTSVLSDLLLNNSNAITEYSIYLQDDWNGVAAKDIFWNTTSTIDSDYVKNTLTTPIGTSNATISVGNIIPDGFAANSTTTASVNTLVKSGTGILKFSSANTYTGQTQINNGELWIESGGDISASSGIYVGNGGSTSNVAKLWLSNLTGGTTFSRSFTINNGNADTRVIGGFNTSGTNTFSGNITNNSANLNLSALTAGGTTDFTGVISGGNPIITDGLGTVKLSNSNTYTGTTTIRSGTLSIASNNALGFGSLLIGSGGTTGTLAVTATTSRSQSINVTDGSTAGVIDVASGQTFTLSGGLANTGSNNSTKFGKSGPGTFIVSGTSTYAGQIQIGDGTVIVQNSSGLGANTTTAYRGIDLGLNVGDFATANNVLLQVTNGITVPQSIYVATNNGSATHTIGLNGTGATTFSNEIYLGGDVTLTGGSGAVTFSGKIINTGAVKVTGGNVVLSGANTYSGGTTISSGTLQLGAAGVLPDAGTITLNGGILSTGASTGFAETVGTLNLAASSTIALGTGNHTLTFANSSAVSWAGAVLTITGWTGTAGSSGTAGKIVVGAGGLSQAQLDKIQFSGYSIGAKLVSGEVVPKGTSSISITGTTTFTYTGSAQGPAANVTGSTGIVSYSYNGVSGTTYGPSATAPTNVGSYTVIATVAADANYYTASSSATAFTIGKATPTATLAVSNSPATYTGSGQSATVSISSSSVAGTFSSILTGGTATQTAAGTYAVTASFVPTDTTNYTILTGLSAGNFVIGKATLTVTANSQSVCYGTLVTSVTGAGSYTVTGYVTGEDASVISGTATYSTTYTATTTAGTTGVVVTPVVSGLSATNYQFTAASGTVTILSNLPASVSIAASPSGAICAGTSVTFTATPTNGGTPTYQWNVNGTAVSGQTSSMFTTAALLNNDVVTVVMTSTASPCMTGSPATSTGITMTVNPVSNANLTTASPQTQCVGGTFSPLSVTATGTSPITYQWYSNTTPNNSTGVSLGAGAQTSSYTPLATTAGVLYYYCVVSSACGSGVSSAISGSITVNPSATASITNSNNLICPGSDAVFNLTGTSGAVVTYSINGGANATTSLAGGTAAITITNPTSDQTLTLVSVASNGCTTTLGTTYTIGSVTTTYNGTTWDNGLPNSYKTVIFNGNYTVLTTDNDFDACSIQVATGVTVTVESGRNVNLNGSIKVAAGGNFILNNNTNLLQANDLAENTGNITVKRNSAKIVRLDHTLWSSPVVGQQLFSFSPATLTNRFYSFDTTNNYYINNTSNPLTFTTASVFSPTVGYAIRAPNNQTAVVDQSSEWTGTFVGVPNNGTKQFALVYSNTANAANYNLVGNPFPSTIDAYTFCVNNASKIDGNIYFYQHTVTMNASGLFTGGTNYSCWNESGYALASAGDGHTPNVIPNGVIQVGQGFFVKAKSSGSLDFTNDIRFGDQNHQFLKTTNTTEKHRLWLNLLSDTGVDKNQILVGYIAGATQGLDDKYDGLLFGNTGSYLYSTINGSPYVIQGRALPFNTSDEVPLGFNCDVAGTFSIKLSNMDGLFSGNQEVFIRDNLTGTDTNIKTAPYTFTSDVGTYEDRFKIVYTQALGVPSNTFNDNSVIVYKNTDWFHVSTKGIVIKDIMVYDVSGRLIYKLNDVNDTTSVLKGLSQTKQVLFVKVISQENQSVTIKVIN